MSPEIWFYHCERKSVDEVLPTLLEKTVERQWRAVVHAGSADRVAFLDRHLWTWREESFLPHASSVGKAQEAAAGDPWLARQPIVVTDAPINPNGAQVRFALDGTPAAPEAMRDMADLERVIFLFSGREPAELDNARQQWKALKKQGAKLTYWQQDEGGRWAKKA